MDTKSTDLRVPSEEDAAAAELVKINWAHELGNTPAMQAKKYHTERLCYSAVSGGFMREIIGVQPDTILIRAPAHNHSYNAKTKSYVRDQSHITVWAAGRGIHIYIRPNNTRTSAEHYVTHVTAGKGQGRPTGG